MKNFLYWKLILLCSSTMFLFSCEFFTTSLGDDLVRNQSELMQNASTEQLVELSAGTGSTNRDTALAIIDALSQRTDELLGFEVAQKEAVLDLMLDLALPIGSVLSDIVDVGTSGSHFDKKFIQDMIANAPKGANVTVATALLTDQDMLRRASISTLVDAAVATIAHVAVNLGDQFTIPNVNYTDFETKPATDIATSLMGASQTKEKKALVAAIQVLQLLAYPTSTISGLQEASGGRTIDPNEVNFVGLISIADVLRGISTNAREVTR